MSTVRTKRNDFEWECFICNAVRSRMHLPVSRVQLSICIRSLFRNVAFLLALASLGIGYRSQLGRLSCISLRAMHSLGHNQLNTVIPHKNKVDSMAVVHKGRWQRPTYSWPWRNLPLRLNALSATHFRFWHKRRLLHILTVRRIDLLSFASWLLFVAAARIQAHANTLTWPRSDATICRTLWRNGPRIFWVNRSVSRNIENLPATIDFSTWNDNTVPY